MEINTLKKEIFKKIYLSKEVYLMAHKNIDLDAFASMAGFSLIARKFKKPVYIIIDDKDIEAATKLAISYVSNNIKIITSNEALKQKKDKALLVILDVNKPNRMNNENIIEFFKDIIIIDHHNITKDTLKIKNLYVDQKATSACEIVTQLLSRFRVKVPKVFATVMLGGIALDTNNFTYKMTKRSFYFCYYLASKGGNIEEAQLMLKQDLSDFVNRTKMVANTKIDNEIAIATGERTKIYSPQDLAKTADLLLSFKGIKNAFAIGKTGKDTVGISARSLNKVNAGKLMEYFDGGGNTSEAAAIVNNKSVKEVESEIIKLLN